MPSLLHKRIGDGVGHGRGAAVVGRDARRIGDRHAAKVAEHHEGYDRRHAAQEERCQSGLPDRGHTMGLVFVSQFVTADEADRHQQKDRDGVVEFLGDLDAAVDPGADDPQQEAERDRRQQILLQRRENPRDLIARGIAQQRHSQQSEDREGQGKRNHHAVLAKGCGEDRVATTS